ncbi:16S rRNA (cytidine(1402)-2'-O)-methyltransferase [Patescibacteria group bacterium]|jgi:16S rRNA (cytidine1402-2'-O)-methyltransferase|nr:16S rRNA (cytidine(1402)-2'-O)-methyltransferase [Patescibacteria group bacterium]
MSGLLSIVATPIGNLEDITARAVRVLGESDAIACEDTRVTSKLLSHLALSKPLLSVHEHTNPKAVASIVDRIKKGERIAYVCDAGTPGMNDPGGKVVAAVMEAGLKVETIPGPSALTAAISVCGFPMDEFTYIGFIPHKKGRETLFKEIAERETPTVFLESTHRIMKTLEALSKHLDPERMVFIGRELTKLHETLYRGMITDVIHQLEATSTKGEFIVIIGKA